MIPKCTVCDKNAKKAHNPSNQVPAMNHGYYKTCGSKYCIRNARGGKNFAEKKSGIKTKMVTGLHRAHQQKQSTKCWVCKGDKEVGLANCGKKFCTETRRYGHDKFMKSIKRDNHIKLLKRAKKKKDTDDFFEEMNKKAKDQLKIIRKEK